MLNGINVIDRTSLSFTALVPYTCSSINSSELSVVFNQIGSVQCNITQHLLNDRTVSVMCYDIQDSAGRHWMFSLIQTTVHIHALI
jgi:hypothetical protein